MRIFSFGCSFTYHKYPTWADIIAYDIDPDNYYTYGLGGLGNVGIQCRFLKAILDHNITKEDIVLLQWSSWAREDRYIKGEWKAHGNIMHGNNYPIYWIRDYWDEENDIFKNSTAIITTNKAYGNLITYQINGPEHIPISKKSDVYKSFKNHLPKLHRIPCDSPYENINDSHPSIKDHMNSVRMLGYKLKNNTVEVMNKLHQKMCAAKPEDNTRSFWRKYKKNTAKVIWKI